VTVTAALPNSEFTCVSTPFFSTKQVICGIVHDYGI
jgi:hypothetical protein